MEKRIFSHFHQGTITYYKRRQIKINEKILGKKFNWRFIKFIDYLPSQSMEIIK